MTAHDVLRRLTRLGVRVRVSGPDRLTLTFEDGVLDGELIDAVRDRKREIIELYATDGTHACTQCRRFAFRRPTLCYWCSRSGSSGHDATEG